MVYTFMPSIRLASVAGSGLLIRGACRSMEASKAAEARRVSQRGGVASALVGVKPSRALPNAHTAGSTKTKIIPKIKLRMNPPIEHRRSGYPRLQLIRVRD